MKNNKRGWIIPDYRWLYVAGTELPQVLEVNCMPISREDFVDYISKKICDDEFSIFLGAGISTPLGIPSWKALLEPLALRLHLDIETQYDYFSLAQYYANMYGKAELKKHIGNSMFSFNIDNDTLEKILKLNLRTIWTTNFDTTIERILQSNLIRYQVVNNDKSLANISPSEATTIYKLNGDCNDLENIIITMEDWEAYEETHPTMITFLKKELVSNTFLFYGYSFQDNLVKSMLSGIKRFVGDSCNTHFSIQCRKPSKEFEYQLYDLEQRYHVKTLLVESYEEVSGIFDEIIERVRKYNIFVSGRMGDIEPEIEDQACILGRKLSKGLLENGYNLSTGMGRKIGYFIAGPSIQYLLEKGYKHIEQRLKVRPFDDTMSTEKRTAYRRRLIEENNAVIFMYGHSSRFGRSPGMWEEYQIAKSMRKILIPIGSTGYESSFIWEDIKAHLTEYPYLETSIDDLKKEHDADKLTSMILKLIALATN